MIHRLVTRRNSIALWNESHGILERIEAIAVQIKFNCLKEKKTTFSGATVRQARKVRRLSPLYDVDHNQGYVEYSSAIPQALCRPRNKSKQQKVPKSKFFLAAMMEKKQNETRTLATHKKSTQRRRRCRCTT